MKRMSATHSSMISKRYILLCVIGVSAICTVLSLNDSPLQRSHILRETFLSNHFVRLRIRQVGESNVPMLQGACCRAMVVWICSIIHQFPLVLFVTGLTEWPPITAESFMNSPPLRPRAGGRISGRRGS